MRPALAHRRTELLRTHTANVIFHALKTCTLSDMVKDEKKAIILHALKTCTLSHMVKDGRKPRENPRRRASEMPRPKIPAQTETGTQTLALEASPGEEDRHVNFYTTLPPLIISFNSVVLLMAKTGLAVPPWFS